MKKLILTFLFLATMAPAVAQPMEARLFKIDSLLSYFTANNKFMGSVAIREKGKVVFERAYGYADVENKLPATATTKYKIGSITKMFTASVIFQLIEERKLSLDTKLSEYYPKVRNAENITIKNLLNHSSGIYNFTNDTVFMGELKTFKPHKEMLKLIEGFEPVFEPGSRAEYSNSNYLLLGYIIEDILKKPYKDVVMDRVIKKAGLKNTYYYSKINPRKNEAYSYYFEDDKWVKHEEWNESVAGAAGALQSTPSDLTQFVRVLFDGKIIKKQSLDEMTTLDFGYGKGIFQFPFGERHFYGHNGGIESFTSSIGYYPKEDLAVSVIVNGDNYDMNEITIGILSIYYKLPYQFPNLKTVNVAESILKSYEGTYSSPGVPLKIQIVLNGKQLTAQATGQGAFPLNPVSDTEFNFTPAGITLKFSKDAFSIIQGGSATAFTKEK